MGKAIFNGRRENKGTSWTGKLTKAALVVASSVFSALPSTADEGMWTLYNLPQAVYEQMQAEGFTLPYADLYESQNAIKNNVVNFSGYCSGVVVSPDGLVFTNHHCGFSAINSHSTVEHDYMLNGFYAKSYDEELPNENMFVSFMRDQKDITAQVLPMLSGKSTMEQSAILDSLTNAMTDSVEAIDSTLHVEIDPFYEGNKYYATTYQNFTDLRLVFTLPKSMGKYGGETDNWMWPRQTCDFSVFRVYAGKDNRPAPYSKDNVPYHPKSWAPVSLQGYKSGSFSMTVGYPGSTERYLSSYGIENMKKAENDTRIQVRAIKLAILKKYMDADEKDRINYEDAFARSANYYKNSIGMNKCIDSIGIIQQKQAYEEQIKHWQDTSYVSEKVDFEKLKNLYAKSYPVSRALNYWSESFWNSSELLGRAIKLASGTMEPVNPDAGEKKQYVVLKDNYDKWNVELDKELTCAMLKNFGKQVPKEYLPPIYTYIRKKYGDNYNLYVDEVYRKTKLLTPGMKFFINKKSLGKDPAVELGADLVSCVSVLQLADAEHRQNISDEERKLCAAKIRMEQDMPHYSDANFTMRLSYGQVGGYQVGGHLTNYYTDPQSIVAKMDQGDKNPDYKAEPIMRELLSQKDYGKYQDSTTHTLQLCFLTNNDITGGNSGSPIFDGQGRLIGLAFDGNWDSLSSDINFDKVLSRCIGVDIRYVLYMMDKWGHADRLLKEINAK